MEAIGVFSSCVTALMKLSCRSFRRTSRTRKIVFSTTPAINRRKNGIPTSIGQSRRQFRMIQPILSAIATPTRHTPSAMKKIMAGRRRVMRILVWFIAGKSRILKGMWGRMFLCCAGWPRVFGIVLRNLHIACKAHFFKQPDAVIIRVEFIPFQSVARRDGMSVVVVVPAFASGQQGHPPVVARIIAGGEAAGTPHMRGGIDKPCSVKSNNNSKEDAPEHPAPSSYGEQQQSNHC